MSVAAIVITKNEERNIAACLACLAWVDERIVVDASSTDRTVEIAEAAGARVFIRAWPGYGPQKNFGIEQTQAEWILIVDADERINVQRFVEKTFPVGQLRAQQIFARRWRINHGAAPAAGKRGTRYAAHLHLNALDAGTHLLRGTGIERMLL